MADSQPDSPRVIALPPFLFGGALALGLLVHLLYPIHLLAPWLAWTGGGCLLLLGLALGKWGEDTLRRAGTSVNPVEPTTAIVTQGPFRFSRNPLYLSLTLAYLGISLLVNALWPLLLLPPLLVVVAWGVIAREERYLEAKFGALYLGYKARVRRWL